MKITDILEKADRTLFSFELLPPLRGQDAQKLYSTIEELMEFDPRYINITTHRDEIEYKEVGDQLLKKRYVRKRPGTVAIAAAIQNKYQVPVVPHVLCGGFNKEETENMLIDLNFLGIDNVLALRGDQLKFERSFRPDKEGHTHAIDLVKQIVDLKKGHYLDQDLKDRVPMDFCCGVAGYPEKHIEAPNTSLDLEYLKQKVDAGASYIVTQMFFDNQKYFDFVDRCREADIHVPIIPGIKPIANLRQLTVLPTVFNLDLPEELAKQLVECKTNKEAKQVGTSWAINQITELKECNVPSIHLYTYGLNDNVKEILRETL